MSLIDPHHRRTDAQRRRRPHLVPNTAGALESHGADCL